MPGLGLSGREPGKAVMQDVRGSTAPAKRTLAGVDQTGITHPDRLSLRIDFDIGTTAGFSESLHPPRRFSLMLR